MTLDVSTVNGILIVGFGRRLDSDNAPSVENELKKSVEHPPAQVLFDFSRTEYIASAGLRILLVISRAIHRSGGSVALASLSPQVRKVFEIAGFTQIFSIFPTREEALQYLRKKP